MLHMDSWAFVTQYYRTSSREDYMMIAVSSEKQDGNRERNELVHVGLSDTPEYPLIARAAVCEMALF